MSTLVQLRTHTDAESGPDRDAAAADSDALARDLAAALDGEVRFDRGTRGAYSRDASNYRQIPIGVVLPKTTDDVLKTVEICRRHGAPIIARGGGTSLAGQCCNVAVMIDFSKYMNRVLEVDPERRIARVQPGCVLDDLRSAAKEFGLTYGPDPATHNRCTLGGMVGNNSCGIHSVLAANYGPGPRTEQQVEELVVVTYDGEVLKVGPTNEALLQHIVDGGGRRGEIYGRLRDLRDRYAHLIRERFPDIPRRVSGYNLPELLPENDFNVARALVGTESTCALTLEITVKLCPEPKHRALIVLGYPDVYHAGDDVVEVMKFRPIGLEGMDSHLINDIRRTGTHSGALQYLPDGEGYLVVEFMGDTPDEARANAEALERWAEEKGVVARLFTDPSTQEEVWQAREAGLGATAWIPGKAATWPGWEDAAVPPEKVGDYLRAFRQLLERYGYDCALYGHFGQGCIHTRIDFELTTDQGIRAYLAFIDEAADLVVTMGGSLSGEHGDGQSRAALLPRMYGSEIVAAFREFKSIWDPQWRMNPGKVVEAYRPDENLALGRDYEPIPVETTFQYPHDDHDFHHATLRCVGVGKCRRKEGGTMCPSYMVTHDEVHSTRGRARLLFEMLQGDVIEDGWKSDEVFDALDLCLACKGCKGDCPVQVDMATYKAEFLHHYYEGRLRPRAFYSMGLIYWWARLAAFAPRLVNAVMHAPALSGVIKRIGGVSTHRTMPRFATRTLRDWFRDRPRPNAGGPPLLLWPDTFNNFWHPEIGIAGVEVLESAGFDVRMPEAMLCCGRPLYDYGALDVAKRLLRQILDALRDDIRAGVPVVGLEPSCVSTFREELVSMFPHDPDARRLSEQTYILSEFLDEKAKDFVHQLPELSAADGATAARAAVHGHCHHRSVLRFDAEKNVLDHLGLEYDVLDSGCCGMAGSFGFEADHFDISQACGERVLLPRVRDADADTIVVTDGFSCREQIEQNTSRRPLHLAELIRMALRQAGRLPASDEPEAESVPDDGAPASASRGAAYLALAGLGLAAGALAARSLLRR